MALVTVEVPAVLVAPLRETVVLLYQATAEALYLTLRAGGEHRRPSTEVHEHRARLAELDAVLERLGWPGAPAAGEAVAEEAVALEAVSVTAPRDLLHDALFGALIDAGERLAEACDRSWRGEPGAERVRAAASEVMALDRLLGELPG